MNIYTLQGHILTTHPHLDSVALNTRLTQVLEQLDAGARSFGLHFQRWHTRHKLFSFRLNRDQRIHCCFHDINGERSLALLGYHHTHDDYMASPWKNPKYFQENLAKANFELYELPEQKVFFEDPENQTVNHLEFTVEPFDLVLSSEQNQVLSINFPFVLRGGPGSGKTTLAAQVLKNNIGALPGLLLYVCRSEKLARDVHRQLATQPLILVRTLEELQLASKTQAISEQRFMSFDDLHAWCDKALTTLKKQKSNQSASSLSALDLAKEFELLHSFYITFNNIERCYAFYQNLGDRQTLAKNKAEENDEKVAVIRLHRTFWAHHAHIITPALLPLDSLNQDISMIVIDESQDMVLGDLIKFLSCGTKLLACYDPLQTIAHDVPHQTDTLELLRAFSKEVFNQKIEIIDLSVSFRCPPAVTELADTIKNLKKELVTLVGGNTKGLNKVLSSAVEDNGIPICWLDPTQPNFEQSFDKITGAADYAVITHEDYIDEAKKLYPPELVFSSAEVKGLQFNHVIVYLPFGREDDGVHKLHVTLNQLLSTKIAKADSLNEEDIAKLLHPLIVNITRTLSSLWIVQPGSKKISALLERLNYAEGLRHPISLTLREGSIGDWLSFCEQMIIDGQDDRARLAYQNHLQGKIDNDLGFEILKKNMLKAKEEPHSTKHRGSPTSVVHDVKQDSSQIDLTPKKSPEKKTSKKEDKIKDDSATQKVVLSSPKKIATQKPITPNETLFAKKIKLFTFVIQQRMKPGEVFLDSSRKLLVELLCKRKDEFRDYLKQNRQDKPLIDQFFDSIKPGSEKSILAEKEINAARAFIAQHPDDFEIALAALLSIEEIYLCQFSNFLPSAFADYIPRAKFDIKIEIDRNFVNAVNSTIALISYGMKVILNPYNNKDLTSLLSCTKNSVHIESSIIEYMLEPLENIEPNSIQDHNILSLIYNIGSNSFEKQYIQSTKNDLNELRSATKITFLLLRTFPNFLLPIYTHQLCKQMTLEPNITDIVIGRFNFFLSMFSKKTLEIFNKSDASTLENSKNEISKTLKSCIDEILKMKEPLHCYLFMQKLIKNLPASAIPLLDYFKSDLPPYMQSNLTAAAVACLETTNADNEEDSKNTLPFSLGREITEDVFSRSVKYLCKPKNSDEVQILRSLKSYLILSKSMIRKTATITLSEALDSKYILELLNEIQVDDFECDYQSLKNSLTKNNILPQHSSQKSIEHDLEASFNDASIVEKINSVLPIIHLQYTDPEHLAETTRKTLSNILNQKKDELLELLKNYQDNKNIHDVLAIHFNNSNSSHNEDVKEYKKYIYRNLHNKFNIEISLLSLFLSMKKIPLFEMIDFLEPVLNTYSYKDSEFYVNAHSCQTLMAALADVLLLGYSAKFLSLTEKEEAVIDCFQFITDPRRFLLTPTLELFLDLNEDLFMTTLDERIHKLAEKFDEIFGSQDTYFDSEKNGRTDPLNSIYSKIFKIFPETLLPVRLQKTLDQVFLAGDNIDQITLHFNNIKQLFCDFKTIIIKHVKTNGALKNCSRKKDSILACLKKVIEIIMNIKNIKYNYILMRELIKILPITHRAIFECFDPETLYTANTLAQHPRLVAALASLDPLDALANNEKIKEIDMLASTKKEYDDTYSVILNYLCAQKIPLDNSLRASLSNVISFSDRIVERLAFTAKQQNILNCDVVLNFFTENQIACFHAITFGESEKLSPALSTAQKSTVILSSSKPSEEKRLEYQKLSNQNNIR